MISRLFNGFVVLATLEAAGLVFVKVAVAEAYIVESGNVQAELSYSCIEPGEYGECRKNRSHLTIIRDGKTLLHTRIANGDRPVVTYDLSAAGGFQVRDLDGDREPEVIVNTYTGGAHCCTISSIYRYSPTENHYTETNRDWQHSGYRLEDLDHDGIPEWVSGDDRFAYRFASYAASGRPLQIWQYRQGNFIDVSRQFPQLIYENAHQLWQSYQEAKSQGYETKGMLAGYLAAKYLLGQESDGWERVKQAYQAGDRQEFFQNLRRFLEETGYMEAGGAGGAGGARGAREAREANGALLNVRQKNKRSGERPLFTDLTVE